MTYAVRKSLATQTTIFDEIDWASGPPLPELIDQDVNVFFPPTGLSLPLNLSGSEESTQNRIPFWQFTYRVDSNLGLVLTNIAARGTQRSAPDGTLSTERVFSRIDFTDLVVTFDDGSSAPFNVARAMQAPTRSFQFRQNGSRRIVSPPDRLMQWGLQLVLTDNVLTGTGECNVTLEFVMVFRGAVNDFDPGGVPVAMGCFPQLAYTWSAKGATKRVAQFRGSVRITCDNVMAGEHVGMSGMGGVNPPAANIAGFYTDSNTSFENLGKPSSLNPVERWFIHRANLYGIEAIGGQVMGVPATWGLLFDYIWSNFSDSKEIVGVYGPQDGNKFRATTPRKASYAWPAASGVVAINSYVISKKDRQGDYDNIHLHADMGRPDKYGNTQIHAPFCGHSCVHMHWRWSAVAGAGAKSRAWYYNGWSNPMGGTPEAHTTPGAPLVPPNQRVKVAVCAPQATRFNKEDIINLNAPAPLPDRNKMIWYTADILGMPNEVGPAAGQKQVICEHGLGWAYRYSLRSECSTMDDLVAGMATLRWFAGTGPANQGEMADFFEQTVYPNMRYVDWYGTRINQIPNGDYDHTLEWGSSVDSIPVKAENL